KGPAFNAISSIHQVSATPPPITQLLFEAGSQAERSDPFRFCSKTTNPTTTGDKSPKPATSAFCARAHRNNVSFGLENLAVRMTTCVLSDHSRFHSCVSFSREDPYI